MTSCKTRDHHNRGRHFMGINGVVVTWVVAIDVQASTRRGFDSLLMQSFLQDFHGIGQTQMAVNYKRTPFCSQLSRCRKYMYEHNRLAIMILSLQDTAKKHGIKYEPSETASKLKLTGTELEASIHVRNGYSGPVIIYTHVPLITRHALQRKAALKIERARYAKVTAH
jgi:hypothetical protein